MATNGERILEEMDSSRVDLVRHYTQEYGEELSHRIITWAYLPSLNKDDQVTEPVWTLAFGEVLAKVEQSGPEGKTTAWAAALDAMNLRMHVLLSRMTPTVNVSLNLERR